MGELLLAIGGGRDREGAGEQKAMNGAMGQSRRRTVLAVGFWLGTLEVYQHEYLLLSYLATVGLGG